VGSPEIQAFTGSLVGLGASKGVFVTTSTFSSQAYAFASKIPQRVVLIDGAPDRTHDRTRSRRALVPRSRVQAPRRGLLRGGLNFPSRSITSDTRGESDRRGYRTCFRAAWAASEQGLGMRSEWA
jgi:hypothetical protein